MIREDFYHEYVYVTVYYACKDVMMRAVRRVQATKEQQAGHDREIIDDRYCPHCTAAILERTSSARERRAG